MRGYGCLTLAIAAMVLAACAGPQGKGRQTRISTLPEEARCELRGDGFERVVQTPIRIHLPKKAAPVTIACRAQGFRTTRGTLDTRLDNAVFANLLTGSMLGFVVDVGTGAAKNYPRGVTIVLEPVSFNTRAARDSWYGLYRMYIVQKWDEHVVAIEADCGGGGEVAFECTEEIADARAKMTVELERLEALRKRAPVLPRVALTP